MTDQEKILELSRKRYVHIGIRNDSYDEKTNEYVKDPWKIIDSLAEEILNLLIAGHESLPFEFIIEELTMLGQAPNLLYDDDGRFAVTGAGIQDVVMDDEAQDIHLHHFVETAEWKGTPREALTYYLFMNK